MIAAEITIGQLVAERPDRARLFEKYNIDYCCGGKISLEQACQNKGLNADTITAELQTSDQEIQSQEPDWSREASATVVIAFVLENYHSPLPTDMQRISALMEKVARVHGPAHAMLKDMEIIWRNLREELEMHLRKEEMILFPMIQELEKAASGDIGMPDLHCGSVGNPIRQMELEHDGAGEALQRMHELSNGFQPPEAACNSWRVLYNDLKKFEVDLHRHIHLENHVLHPLAHKLEQSFN